MMRVRIRFGAIVSFVFSLTLTLSTAAVAGAAQPISGDFNGDGRSDVLLQPADASSQVRITLADGAGNLTLPGRTWNADYLSLHWSADTSKLVIGDFTGDGRSDVLLQPLQSGGTGAVLLADANGQFHAVNQLIANPYLGLDWSAASHALLAGDFAGNGRQDILLQTVTPGGINLVVRPNARGVFNTTGQSWADGYLGLQWSAQDVTLYTGDFTGNGRSDLLMQVNDPLADTGVPAYTVLLADANGEFTRISQSWGTTAFGADWSPATHTLLIQDVTGSGVDDIVLMSKQPGGSNYLFLGNQTGTFTKPDLTWTGTQSAKAAWAAKMATGQSITVNADAASSLATAKATPPAAQPQAVTAQAIVTPNAVGTMGGESGVNGGAATYTIPIAVPPGRAGMQPALSLNYSSRGGNGDLGMGWSLSGLSAITRCPATYAQDGYTQGVTYSSAYDRLCLDGSHLVKVTGTYGQSGSVYRTELDSRVRVMLNGGDINAASAWFEVDYQDGRRAYYGTGANTRFIAAGAAWPLVWAIAQMEDAAGNNVVYNYQAYGNGEYHISSIDYTGTSSGKTVNSTGNREVDFTYSVRSDPGSVWLAGGLTRQTRLLNQIKTRVAGKTVRQYSLGYTRSAATGRSLLQSVQACGYAPGSVSLACLPPDTFTWQQAPLSFAAPQAFTVPSTLTTGSGVDCTNSCGLAKIQSYLGMDRDFDGDGRREWYYLNAVTGANGIFWVDDPGKYIDFTKLSPAFSPAFLGQSEDFRSDGLAEGIGVDGGNVGIAWCTDQASGCSTAGDFTNTKTALTYSFNGVFTGEFVGDGLPHFIMPKVISAGSGSYTYGLYLYPNTTVTGNGAPSISSAYIRLGQVTTQVSPTFSQTGDLDGNGLPDLLISAGSPYAVAFVRNTSGKAAGTTAAIQTLGAINLTQLSSASSLKYHSFADINGDGLPDFVFVGMYNNDIQYQINEGGRFGPVVDTGVAVPALDSSGTRAYQAILIGDFTGDGKDELLVPVKRVSTYCMWMKKYSDKEQHWMTYWPCGNDLYSINAAFDHSVFNYQVLEFALQPASGKYLPAWVMSGAAPVSVNAEAGTTSVGDVRGSGLAGLLMLSSSWYENGEFNQLEDWPGGDINNGCSSASTNTACAPVLPTGYYTIRQQNGAPDLMTTAVNGLGAQAGWSYDSLTDLKKTGGYTVERPCSSAPNVAGQRPAYYCFTSSMWVVSGYSVSNATGGRNRYGYQYNDAVYNNQGRGFQGFKSITTSFNPEGGSQDATATVRSYHQDFPMSGMLEEERVYAGTTPAGILLAKTDDTWRVRSPSGCLASGKVFWPQLTRSVVTRNGTDGTNISTATTSYTYDGYGNTTQVMASTRDATGTYATTTRYSRVATTADCSDWWLGNFDKKTVTVSARYVQPLVSQPAAIMRSVNYTYTALRKIQEEHADPDSSFEKASAYSYDGYGNAIGVQVTSGATVPAISAIASRTVSSDYSATDGYFADAITNAAGQTSTITSDVNTGQPLTVTDPNGVVTTYGYDAFGRKISEQVSAPISLPATTVRYQAPAAVCPAGTVYSVITARSGFPGGTACHDRLNHVLRTATDSFAAGPPALQDTRYDALGRVIFTSEPYFSGQTESGTTIHQYDVLNRVLNKTGAEGVDTAYAYSGLTATATITPHDSPAFTTVTVTNSLGMLMSTVDAQGSTTQFRYDAQGNPILIQDMAGHRTLATYNTLSQKTAVTDPDMGHWTYVYDILGNLVQQTDAKHQAITQSFDALNRMTVRTRPEGATRWTYDSCTHGAGKLCNVIQYDGYQKIYTYDGDGRVSNVDELINGQHYATGTAYDNYGRVSDIAYPAGVSAAAPIADAGAAQSVWPNTTVTLNGSGSSGSNGLPLRYHWTQTGGPAVTLNAANSASATFASGPPGTAYSFQLTVMDGLVSATASTSVTVLTAPGAPTDLRFNPNSSISYTGNYTLAWSPPVNGIVTGYTVYESLNGGTPAEYGSVSGATTAYPFSGKGRMSANDVYGYQVAACNPSGCSKSGGVSETVAYPPDIPGSVSIDRATSTNGILTVSWAKPAGVVSGYQIAESVNGGGYSVISAPASCTGASATWCTLYGRGSPNGNYTYAYKVQAYNLNTANTKGYSGSSPTVRVTLPPTTPTGIMLPANSNGDGSFTVNWSASTGYQPEYTVQLGEYVDGPGTQIVWIDGDCVSSSTSCTYDANATLAGAYFAHVRACNLTACSLWGQAPGEIVVSYLKPPGAPRLAGDSTVTDYFTVLAWNKPATATGYKLFASYEIRDVFGAYTQVYGGSATSYRDDFDAEVQAMHYYVVACNAAGCGPASNVVNTTVDHDGGDCRNCHPLVQRKPGTGAPAAGTGRSTPPPASGSGAPAAGPLAVNSSAAAPADTTPLVRSQSAFSTGTVVTPTVSAAPVKVVSVTMASAEMPAVPAAISPVVHGLPSLAGPSTRNAAHSLLIAHSTQHPARSSLVARSTQHVVPSRSYWHYGPTVSEFYATARAEPAASLATQVGLTVHYSYTATGYLRQLSNAVGGQVYWTATAQDAFGQITSENYGNGIVSTIAHNDPLGRITGISSTHGSTRLQGWTYDWDALGNLTSRVNSATGNASETFQYDLLNRLTQAQVTNGTGVQPARTYAYDALGNITSKSDTGSYTYGATRPHAVTSISGPAGGAYSYDANGNMVNRSGTAITWNSDNLPVSITRDGSSSSSFAYAPDKHRYYQSAVINGVAETTVHAGAFEAVTTNGVTKYRYHMSAASREVAEVSLWNNGTDVKETVSYILSDHLGSVDVVQSVDQASGAVTTREMSFSAWGGRRDPSTWDGALSAADASTDHNADRYGFTHQEMLDNVDIIHMNGRIYDPNLSRFLSVDPVFEFPTNTQSLNPYSYVLNNPLSYTDPTGYSCSPTDTLTECSNKVGEGQASDVKKAITGSHIQQTVGSVGKDSGGNLYVAAGNGAQNRSQGSSTTVQQNQVRKDGATNFGSSSQTGISEGSDSFIGGLFKGILDDLARSSWYTSPNPLIDPHNELSLAGQTGKPFTPIFGGSDSNIGQLGYGLAPAALLLGSIVTRNPAIAESVDSAILPERIAATFRNSEYSSHILHNDVRAFRFSSEVGADGRYLTTQQTVRIIASPEEAIKALKLPEYNTAQYLDWFIIPHDTRIFYGRVNGGWQDATQIFIRDSSVLKRIP